MLELFLPDVLEIVPTRPPGEAAEGLVLRHQRLVETGAGALERQPFAEFIHQEQRWCALRGLRGGFPVALPRALGGGRHAPQGLGRLRVDEAHRRQIVGTALGGGWELLHAREHCFALLWRRGYPGVVRPSCRLLSHPRLLLAFDVVDGAPFRRRGAGAASSVPGVQIYPAATVSDGEPSAFIWLR